MRTTSKEPVRLREKKLKGDNISLYLDIYMGGVRRYEFLHLYLIKERNRTDREKNRQTLQLANIIKDKRIVELQKGELGLSNVKSSVLFCDYYLKVTSTKKKGTRGSWIDTYKYIIRYDQKIKRSTFKKINKDWVKGFRNYLGTTKLAQNTQCIYIQKLIACIHQAIKDGIISEDPTQNIDYPKMEETERMYLTLPEVRKLAKTPCLSEETKRAFLFSCLTGLRISDIRALRWADLQKVGKFMRITFRQKKTGGLEYLDIAPEAAEILGDPEYKSGHVFDISPYGSVVRYQIALWCKNAGINKKITFHCARHTFATLMLTIGTDLYTVSKLLGHKDIATTQIYAKVIDKNKQDAVSRIPDIFGGPDKKIRG